MPEFVVWYTEDVGGGDDSRHMSMSFASQADAGYFADALDECANVSEIKCSWLMTPAECAAMTVIPF